MWLRDSQRWTRAHLPFFLYSSEELRMSVHPRSLGMHPGAEPEVVGGKILPEMEARSSSYTAAVFQVLHPYAF